MRDIITFRKKRAYLITTNESTRIIAKIAITNFLKSAVDNQYLFVFCNQFDAEEVLFRFIRLTRNESFYEAIKIMKTMLESDLRIANMEGKSSKEIRHMVILLDCLNNN